MGVVVLAGCSGLPEGKGLKQIAMVARPEFENDGTFTTLRLTDGECNYSVSWGMPPDVWFVPVTLDTNRTYRFTIMQRPTVGLAKVRKVEENGQTIYDEEICEVHQVRMEHKRVRIRYGLIRPGPNAPDWATERDFFPHGREYSLGGCVSMPSSPKQTKVYVCGACKEAYSLWMRQHSLVELDSINSEAHEPGSLGSGPDRVEAAR